MSYPDAETLLGWYDINVQVIRKQTEGLSHADGLLQPPVRGNCMNWVLGHIVVGRDRVLKYLGEPSVLEDSEAARYKRGSEAITEGEEALPLDRLLGALEDSQRRLETALGEMTPRGLAHSVHTARGERPLGEYIGGRVWHETYHVGQLELLRQLAGTDDAVIE